jgi:hypothetical protein
MKHSRPGQLDSKALGATIKMAGQIAGFVRSNELCYATLYISLTLTLNQKEKQKKKKSHKREKAYWHNATPDFLVLLDAS